MYTVINVQIILEGGMFLCNEREKAFAGLYIHCFLFILKRVMFD